MGIVIDSGIPIAPKHSSRGREGSGKYEAATKLQVGDSFLLQTRNECYSALCFLTRCQRLKGNRYTTRKVEGGYRIWRIK